jgi:hypothetical protein
MSRIRLLSVPPVGIAAMIVASEHVAETSVTAINNAPLAPIWALHTQMASPAVDGAGEPAFSNIPN